MSKFRCLAALISVSLLTDVTFASASEVTLRASVTVGGESITLPYARAFSTGMPYILIYFAEKPLDSFEYGTGGNDSTWSDGRYGTVLRLAPAMNPQDQGKPVVRYVIPEAAANEDDRVTLRSPSVENWQEQLLSQMNIEISQLESSHGVVRGTLSWQGEAPISAWSVEFTVPLEGAEGGGTPSSP